MKTARDIVAVILGGTIGAILVIVVIGVVLGGRSLTAGGAEALIAIVGALVGALGGYLVVHKANGGKTS